jgi:hypothetical protein
MSWTHDVLVHSAIPPAEIREDKLIKYRGYKARDRKS